MPSHQPGGDLLLAPGSRREGAPSRAPASCTPPVWGGIGQPPPGHKHEQPTARFSHPGSCRCCSPRPPDPAHVGAQEVPWVSPQHGTAQGLIWGNGAGLVVAGLLPAPGTAGDIQGPSRGHPSQGTPLAGHWGWVGARQGARAPSPRLQPCGAVSLRFFRLCSNPATNQRKNPACHRNPPGRRQQSPGPRCRLLAQGRGLLCSARGAADAALPHGGCLGARHPPGCAMCPVPSPIPIPSRSRPRPHRHMIRCCCKSSCAGRV